MVAAESGRSSQRRQARRCAARATTAPTFARAVCAGAAGASPQSACRPRGRAPTSASTATSCPSPSVCTAGGTDPASGWRRARRRVFVACPEPRAPARTAALSGLPASAGPKVRCVIPATTPRSAGGERARAAAANAGWCHLRAPAPPAVVTARGLPRCTPAPSAGARTSSMNGAAATDALSPAAPPR